MAECMDLVSEEGLKREGGAFDLETILFLDLSDRGLHSVGTLPKCSQLRILNLSCNHLTSAAALGSLSNLEQLNLSANQIASLDGLERLEVLGRLDLPGNGLSQLLHRLVFNSSHLQAIENQTVGRPRNEATRTAQEHLYPSSSTTTTNTHIHTYIHRLESLLPLAGLVHLKSLSLRLPGTKLTNPVCSIASYEAFMQDTFPLLIWLDGEKVSGPGSEFYSRCKELDGEHANGCGGDEVHVGNSSREALDDPLADFSLNDERADEVITKLLSECSEMSERTQRHIATLKKGLAQT